MDNINSDQGSQTGAAGALAAENAGVRGKNNAIAIALLLFLFISAIGAAIFLTKNHPSMTPETVLQKMVQNMAGAQTMEFYANIDGEVKFYYGKDLATADNTARDTTDLDISLNGQADLADPENQKTSFNLQIGNNDYLGGSLYFDSVTAGNILYAKLSGTANLRNDEKLAPFWGQWTKIDLANIAGQITRDYPELAKKIGKPIIKGAISPEQAVEMRNAFADAGLFIFKSDLGADTVNGADCYHYEVEITKDALRGYVRELGAIAQDQVSQQYMGQLLDMIGQAEISNAEVWISKNDFTLRRVSAEADYRDDLSGMISYSANLSGDIGWPAINGEVKIEVPAEAKDFSDIFKQSSSYIQSAARDEIRRSDMRALVLAQTKYYQVYGRYFSFDAVDGGCDSPSGACARFVPDYMPQLPVDPLSDGLVCGSSYFYCNIGNAKNNQRFCAYAKLEGGGYYTASKSGNFERSVPPSSFFECEQSDRK